MKHSTARFPRWIFVFGLLGAAAIPVAAQTPIRQHPENPHYLLYQGKPTVLVTSAEHYSAVLNLNFDYVAYLDELQRYGLNLTRTFSGVYREDGINPHGSSPLSPGRARRIISRPGRGVMSTAATTARSSISTAGIRLTSSGSRISCARRRNAALSWSWYCSA